jgi:hypothetical protein
MESFPSNKGSLFLFFEIESYSLLITNFKKLTYFCSPSDKTSLPL